MFNGCSKLKYLPDISSWKTHIVYNMKYLFANCSSLLSMPDISQWETFNVIDMRGLFMNCSSLTYLPDISNWNTYSLKAIDFIFSGCHYLISKPDISKWSLDIMINRNHIFDEIDIDSSFDIKTEKDNDIPFSSISVNNYPDAVHKRGNSNGLPVEYFNVIPQDQIFQDKNLDEKYYDNFYT